METYRSRYYPAPDRTYLGVPDETSTPILPGHPSYVVRHANNYVGMNDKGNHCEFGHTNRDAWRFDSIDTARVVGSACAEMMGYTSYRVEHCTQPPSRNWWER